MLCLYQISHFLAPHTHICLFRSVCMTKKMDSFPKITLLTAKLQSLAHIWNKETVVIVHQRHSLLNLDKCFNTLLALHVSALFLSPYLGCIVPVLCRKIWPYLRTIFIDYVGFRRKFHRKFEKYDS